MKDRIALLVKSLNYTATQFADEIGVQKSGISHVLSGRNNPSLDFVQKILLRFPEVNMPWLMFGKGPMFNDLVMPSAQSATEKPAVPTIPDLFSFAEEQAQEIQKPSSETPEEKTLPKPSEIPAGTAKQPLRKAVLPSQGSGILATPDIPRQKTEPEAAMIVIFYADSSFKVFNPSKN